MQFVCRSALLVTIAVLASALFSACTWEPVTRPLQPESVLGGGDAGVFDIERSLDWEGRHVLVRETVGEKTRWHFVETEKLESCMLPEGTPIFRPLVAPGVRGKDAPKLLVPLRRREGDVDVLWMADEKCRERGPYGTMARRDPEQFSLRSDGRLVLLVLDDKLALRLVDPWTEKMQPIAPRVDGWAPVVRSDSGPRAREPEALWLLEEGAGVLRQRALDGTLLVEIGRDVRVFVQRLSSSGTSLRIAFEAKREVFEAVSPDYVPVRIATDACNPSYEGEALDVHTPCDKQQLVRVENNQARFFPEGVTRIFPRGEVTFQLVRAPNENELWAATSDGNFRIKLTPTPQSPITVLDSVRVAGRTTDGRFGLWSARDGSFQAVANGVRDVIHFNTSRSSQHAWLMYHDSDTLGLDPTKPPEDDPPGVLSSFDLRALFRAHTAREPVQLTRIGTDVPSSVGRGPGFIAYTPSFYQEAMVLIFEQPPALDPSLPKPPVRLSARLLSGVLGAPIDDNVSSALLVFAPRPGVLYTVADGPRSGLWFTAL